MNEQYFDGYLADLEMCIVFVDALSQLKAENSDLLETSLEMTNFLKDKYDDENLQNHAKLYVEAVANKSEIINHALLFIDSFNICTFESLLNITNEVDLPLELVNEYFLYYNKLSYMSPQLLNKLFYFVQSYNYKLPEQVFNLSVHILNLYPKMINSESKPYVYSNEHEQFEFKSCPICGGNGKAYFTANAFAMDYFAAPHLPFKLWMKCGFMRQSLFKIRS